MSQPDLFAGQPDLFDDAVTLMPPAVEPDTTFGTSPAVAEFPAFGASPATGAPPAVGAPPVVGAPPANSASDSPEVTVEVRRSTKRRKTISAYQEGDKLVVAIPARLTKAQEREWVAKMVTQVAAKQAKRRPSDEALYQRAVALSEKYLGGKAQPLSVQWVSNQDRRWGSCSVQDKAIRISDRVRGMPEFVLDYVLLHELTHLLHAGHGAGFWAHLTGYPQLERARGFLDGVSYARHQEGTEL